MRGSFFVGEVWSLSVTVEQIGTVFASRNASSNFLQPVLNVSRVWPRDLEPLGGDFDSAKNAVLRTNSKNRLLFYIFLFRALPIARAVELGRLYFPYTYSSIIF